MTGVGARSDFWPARTAYLADLSSADAVGIIVAAADGRRVNYAQHNLGGALAQVPDVGSGQFRPIQLADGRVARHRFSAPLVWNDRRIGSLVGLRVDMPWDPASRHALTWAAGLVTLDLAETYSQWESSRTAEKLHRRARSREEIRQEIGRADDPEVMIELAAKRVRELFGATGVSVMLLQDDDELVVHSAIGVHEQVAKAAHRRLGEGISGWVAKHGEPLLLTGRVDDARFTGVDPTIEEALIVPLRAGSRVLGVVSVRGKRKADAFGSERLEDLNAVAHDLAAMLARTDAAVTRLEMLHRLENDRRQALALFDLARLAGIGADSQADLQAAAALVAHAFRHDVVAIWTADAEEARKLRLRASFGYGDVLPGDVLLDGDELAHAVLADGRPRHLRGSHWRSWTSIHADLYLLIPIAVGADRGGLLVLGRALEPYRDIDLELGTTIADFISSLARRELNARLLEESEAERRRVVQEMQQDFAGQMTRVVMVLDLCQRLLRRDSDLPSQLAAASRDARNFLGRFGAYVAGLQADYVPALVEGLTLDGDVRSGIGEVNLTDILDLDAEDTESVLPQGRERPK